VDTTPVWTVEHLHRLIETEARENNKTFCDQFHSALLSQANSTLAVIISYFTSNRKLELLKLQYQQKVDTYKNKCKQDFQSWIQNGADIRPLLDEYDQKDTMRLLQDNYKKDLSMYIQSFLPEKVQNKILSLCNEYTNRLCQDVISELKSHSQYSQNFEKMADGASSSLLAVMFGSSIGGLTAGVGVYALTALSALSATGAGAIVAVLLLSVIPLIWGRNSVKETLVSSATSHLTSTVLGPTLGHIDDHFTCLGEKIEKFLTISFLGAEEANILRNEEIYKQIKTRISVIKLIKTNDEANKN